MQTPDDLFPPSLGFHPSEKVKQPRLWVRELRVYRALAHGDENLVRRIQLRRGLNILWARPRGQAKRGRVSGHGTGKTTFCRFLRHILGEKAFGTEEQRPRLRSVFPEGWLVGEVFLEGEPWVVCRPFKLGLGSHAYRGRTLDSLFTSEEGRTSFEDYERVLTAQLAEPLPVTTFATSPTPIEWLHLIQWLARDQECRFSGLAELRHTSSDSKHPEMFGEDRHFLFRAVLDLVDTDEQSEIENNKTLVRKRQDAEKQAPLLAFRAKGVYERLRNQLHDFRTDLAGADFLDEVARKWKEKAEATEAELRALPVPEPLAAARKLLVITQSALDTVQRRRRDLRFKAGFVEQKIRQLQGRQSEDTTEKWVRENSPTDDGVMCGHTLAEAIEWECPLAVGRRLAVEIKTTPVLAVGEEIARLEGERTHVRVLLEQVEQDHMSRQDAVTKAQAVVDRETAALDTARANLHRRLAQEEAIASAAKLAHADQKDSEDLIASLEKLDAAIRRSQELQAKIRDASNAALSAFSDCFARVSRTVLDDTELYGDIRFHGRRLRPSIHDSAIDLTSAALETLKILCFDLAALVHGVEGRGRHPLFLVHDGPREADLDAGLYRNLFTAARALEAAFGDREPPFQYIITTTEPPPDELLRAPWLLEPPLDASVPNGKLLGENF